MPVDTSVLRGRLADSYGVINIGGTTGLTLLDTDAVPRFLRFEGAIAQAVEVRVPVQLENAGLRWTIENACMGGFSVTFRTTSGTGVTVSPGTRQEVYCDGANMAPLGMTSLDMTVGGQAGPVLRLSHSYQNGDFPLAGANFTDYSALELDHTNLADTANILSTFDLIWTGLRSAVTYGSSTVLARGTEHGATITVDVQGSASGNNELACWMAWMRAKAADGIPAHGNASLWFTDWSLHGNIGAQNALLNGVTMLVNSYTNATPSRGPSAAAWFVTRQGQGGGREDGHGTAQTYPLDHLVGLFGLSGTVGDVTQSRATNGAALAIGEWGSGWGLVQDDALSWFESGISVRGGEAAAIKIRDPHANSSSAYVGNAILMETQVSGRRWQWWFNAGSAEAPLAGAIQLHDTNAMTANQIQWGSSVHSPQMGRPADGTLRVEIPSASAGGKFHVHRVVLADPAFEVGGTDAVSASLSSMLRNDGGQVSLVVVGGGDNFWTGSLKGDVGLRWDSDQVFGFVGASTLLGSISGAGAWKIAPSSGTVGFFGGGGAAKTTVTGAKGGNAALTSLISALVGYGLITDTTS